MGVFSYPFLRQRNAHLLQKFNGLTGGFLLVLCLMVAQQSLVDLISHCEHRVKGSHGVLKNHCDPFAPNFAHFPAFAWKLVNANILIVVVKMDFSLFDPGQIRQQSHNGVGSDRLAAAGFAYHTEDFSLLQIEVDAPDNPVASIIVVKIHMEVSDADDGIVIHSQSLLIQSGSGLWHPADHHQ